MVNLDGLGTVVAVLVILALFGVVKVVELLMWLFSSFAWVG